MKRSILAVAAVGVLALSACAAPVDRNAVESAIVGELIPDTIAASAADGEESALEFVDQMHTLAEGMASDIIENDACGSPAYAAGLGQSPELAAAHRAGCAVFEA